MTPFWVSRSNERTSQDQARLRPHTPSAVSILAYLTLSNTSDTAISQQEPRHACLHEFWPGNALAKSIKSDTRTFIATPMISGSILRVDLARGTTVREKVSDEVVRKYLGGRALGAKILFEELQPGVEPLGSNNKLVLAAGVVTGAPFSGNSRYTVMAKSPLTDGWGESSGGGFLGARLRQAGLFAAVLEGMARNPVYVYVNDEQDEIRDGSHIWGHDPDEVIDIIKSDVGEDDLSVAHIGLGGENLVRYASVIADLRYAAGRSGMGAVMGSKKVKAIAVRGTRRIEVADRDAFLKFKKTHAGQSWNNIGKLLYDHGQDGGLDALNASGRLPTKAFQYGTFQGAEAITGETMSKTMLIGRHTCFACRTSCYRVVKGDNPYSIDPKWGGPEYESVAALGSLCMIDDLNAICKANELCNKYTLDTISAGMAVAFAMECYEKGLLTKKDTDGLEMTWGNHAAALQLIEKIARREGIGDLLAEGTARAAKKIGRGAEKFVVAVKGQEFPMHEPRGKKGLGLSYAVSNRGACHLQIVEHDDGWEVEANMLPELGLTKPVGRLEASPYKAKVIRIAEDLKATVDSLTWCVCTSFPLGPSMDSMLGIINSVTGWDMTLREFARIGERAVNLCRAFNVREGMSRKDDVLPERMTQPLPDGLYKGQSISKEELHVMLDAYYEERGWDKRTGVPTSAKLRELDLGFAADQLKALRKIA